MHHAEPAGKGVPEAREGGLDVADIAVEVAPGGAACHTYHSHPQDLEEGGKVKSEGSHSKQLKILSYQS